MWKVETFNLKYVYLKIGDGRHYAITVNENEKENPTPLSVLKIRCS